MAAAKRSSMLLLWGATVLVIMVLTTPPCEATLANCTADLTAMFEEKYPNTPAMLLASGLSLPNNLGNVDMCNAITNAHVCVVRGPIVLPMLSPEPINVISGLCLPAGCTQGDLSALLSPPSVLPFIEVYGDIYCTDEYTKDLSTLHSDAGAIAALCLVCFLGLIVAIATLAEVFLVDRDGVPARGMDLGFKHPAGDMAGVGAPDEEGSLSINSLDTYNAETARLLGGAPARNTLADEPSLAWRLLMAFSAFRNTQKLAKNTPMLLNSLNGIRVISMWWIILGHTVLIAFSFASAFNINTVLGNEATLSPFVEPGYLRPNRPTFFQFDFVTLILSAEFAVDTFFMLSGFFVIFFLLRAFHEGKRFSWAVVMLHPFIRLLPALAMMLLLHIKVLPFMGSGPLWGAVSAMLDSTCYKQWWVPPITMVLGTVLFPRGDYNNMCAGWLWFTSSLADMILVVIPIFLILLRRWGHKAAAAGMVAITLASLALGLGVSAHNDLNGYILQGGGAQGTEYYSKAYMRVPAYTIGILLAMVMDYFGRTRGYLPRLSVLPRAALYLVSSALLSLTVFGIYSQYQDEKWQTGSWDKSTRISYLVLSRPAFCLGLGGLCYLFISGSGGAVRAALSAAFWTPLARLTYSAYLLHPVILFWLFGNSLRLATYSRLFLGVHFLATVVFAYVGAYVMYLLVEKPIMNLEAMFFRKGKTS